MRDKFSTDGTLVRRTVFSGDGMAHGVLMQPDRLAILARNAELRKNPQALKNENIGVQVELTIPEVDLYYLKKALPDLDSPDALTRSIAWKKFMASPDADIYRIRERVINKS